MAGPRIRPLHLSSQPELVQAAAASPDGDAFRIVHHPSPQAEVSGWVWAEPHNGDDRGRVGLWALGCGHCGATHCTHVDATLQHLNQVLSAAPTPDTWRIAGAEVPAQLADRARRTAERHHQRVTELRRQHQRARAERQRLFDEALQREAARDPDEPIPLLADNATGGFADRDSGEPFLLDFAVEIPTDRPEFDVTANSLLTYLQDLGLAVANAADENRWEHDIWPVRRAGRLTHIHCSITGRGLYDTAAVWEELSNICGILQAAGAARIDNTWLTVQAERRSGYQVGAFNRLVQGARRYDDLLERLGSPPDTTAGPPPPWRQAPGPDPSYNSLGDATSTYGPHQDRPIGLLSLADGRTLVEVRTAVPGVDPGRLQAHVSTALGLIAASDAAPDGWGPPTPRGTHHTIEAEGGTSDDPDGLVREFGGRIFDTPERLAQLAAIYATTRWPLPRRV